MSAREHPAAAVKRQQERDATLLLPAIQHLTERQHQLFFFFQTVVARYKPEGFTRLVDNDVAEAAGALAATLETSARGVIYEHTAPSLPAQRLVADFKALLDQIRQHGGRVHERETAMVLRAIENGVRAVQATGEGDQAYLALINRLLQSSRGASAPEEAPPKPTSSLILP